MFDVRAHRPVVSSPRYQSLSESLFASTQILGSVPEAISWSAIVISLDHPVSVHASLLLQAAVPVDKTRATTVKPWNADAVITGRRYLRSSRDASGGLW